MAQRNKLKSVGMSRVLSRFIQWAEDAPEGAGDYAVHSLIRLTRNRLGMTQKQLAKRCGLPQSHIANIEKGKIDLQIETLRRICHALCCRLVIGLRPEQDLDSILEERARKLALKRVKRVAGTMVMEEQRPEEEVLSDLVEAESNKILEKRDSEIWEDG